MSITLDDKEVDVFKLYDAMAIACSKDIEGYKALIGTIEDMIAQKRKKLQEIKDKTIDLLKISSDTMSTHKIHFQQFEPVEAYGILTVFVERELR